MYYPEELVEEVRARNDIVDVISGYVSLKKKGSNYWGCCPFHNEKTPSFSVSSNKQMYYCFGCHKGGSAIGFVMDYEHLSYVEALRYLARKYNIEIVEKEETADRILQEFGLAGENVHIINGHVPVHQSAGESPVKCGGKVLIIDGGFCRAYHKETGIAGYTLIYNSYGLSLTAHEPFESTEKAIREEKDIVSRQVAVRYNMKRQLVGDTDQGRQIRQRIRELKELIEAYRTAQLKELL